MVSIKHLIFVILCPLSLCTAQNDNKYEYTHPIDFAPHSYICYSTSQVIQVNGVLDEEAWHKAQWTEQFVDIEGSLKPMPKYGTRVKMLWDDTYFYIAAIIEDPHIWATLKQRDTIIFQNDDFEVFIDPDGDTHNYIELELNALNTVWDLIMLRPYREDRLPKVNNEWNIEHLQTGVHIEGSLNNASDIDSFWSVEIAFPWKSIIEFANPQSIPNHGDQWRINFSRVAWQMDITNGRYDKKTDSLTNKPPYFPQDNWVWSPQGSVAMHQPETWGYVQFSDHNVGDNTDAFISRDEEKIKWALRQIYFQQREYKRDNKTYSSALNDFTVPEVDIQGYTLKPNIVADSLHFTISAQGLKPRGHWVIRQDGKVWFDEVK